MTEKTISYSISDYPHRTFEGKISVHKEKTQEEIKSLISEKYGVNQKTIKFLSISYNDPQTAPEPPETVLSSWNKAQLERLISNYNPEHDINTSATAPPVSWKELALAKSLLKAAEYMAGLEDRIAELELEAQLSKTDTDY